MFQSSAVQAAATASVKTPLNCDDCSFAQIVENDGLMLQYVKVMIKRGNSRGFPEVYKNELVPTKDDIYECRPDHAFSYRKDATKPHKEFLFVRAASLLGAINYCLNHNLYLVHCKPGDMPTGDHWDNYAQVMYPLHAVYCKLQGLPRTHDMVRLLLLYFFYGTYQWSTKDKDGNPVIRVKLVVFGIAKRLMNGRSRFVNGVSTNFEQFIELYDKHPEWEKFLLDKGVGDPPIEYLVALELGLRQYGVSGVHTMGTRPLRSREYWGNVDVWRKREAFIALVRYLKDFPSDYKQWDCFLFTDYIMREEATLTFMRRHLPLSDGNDEEHFGDAMEFDWEKHAYVARKKKKSVKSVAKKPMPKKVIPKTSGAKSEKVMIYDAEKGFLVPLV